MDKAYIFWAAVVVCLTTALIVVSVLYHQKKINPDKAMDAIVGLSVVDGIIVAVFVWGYIDNMLYRRKKALEEKKEMAAKEAKRLNV